MLYFILLKVGKHYEFCTAVVSSSSDRSQCFEELGSLCVQVEKDLRWPTEGETMSIFKHKRTKGKL